MKFLELTPVDVFTVRDARPFDVAGVVHAQSVWPPPPWTLLGALRGALVEAQGVAVMDYAQKQCGDPQVRAVRAAVGEPDGPAKFAIGPALLRAGGSELRWPVPADVLSYEETESGGTRKRLVLRRLRLLDRERLPQGSACSLVASRALLCPPLTEAHPTKSVCVRSFSGKLLQEWLEGKDEIEVREEKSGAAGNDYGFELRIGIQLEPERHTVREGRFYVRQMTALGLGRTILVPVIEPNGLPWEKLDADCMRLGADGHLVSIRSCDREDLIPAAPKSLGSQARLLFLSPVRPEDIEALTNAGLQVHAVAAGRAVRIGGWQLTHDGQKQVGPRPLRTYYPAGTVAYVGGNDLERFHMRSVASDSAEKAAGFGVCLVGAVNS